MKILMYGAGVIGCTYGWQLSKVGHDITVLVRHGKKQLLEENGIRIDCTDFRGGKKQIEQVVFRPKVIDQLSPQNDYEYIIVSTISSSIKEVLPALSASAGKAHIIFFQNMWDDFDEIAHYLSPKQYFFGFPFMAGGGRNSCMIQSVISGLKYSGTLLGELDGKTTPRVVKLKNALEDAGLKPIISNNIKVWLVTHYAIAASLSAGIMKAGGGKAFSSDSKILRGTFKAIKEGLNICSKIGIDPRKEKANRFYYLPLFLSVPIAKNIFGNEGLCLMFDGHTQHAPDEIKKMLKDIMASGEKNRMEMPHLKALAKSVNEIHV